MLNIIALFAFYLLVALRAAPETQFSKAVYKRLIHVAVRKLLDVERRHFLFAVFAVASLPFALQFALMAGTLDAAFIYASQLAIYSDIMLVSLTAVVSMRLRLIGSFFRSFGGTRTYR